MCENQVPAIASLKELLKTALPSKSFPRGLRTYNYMWQYKLTTVNYNKLKELVPKVCGENPSAKLLKTDLLDYSTDGKGCYTIALCVILLLSEWYKRECTTLSGIHAFEGIGIKKLTSDRLKNAAYLSNELFLNINNTNEMRLATMCQLGGFPIALMNENDRFANAIYDIQTEDDISDNTIFDIARGIGQNNRTIRASLMAGSCRGYLESLARYFNADDERDYCPEWLPFAAEDTNERLFANFLDRLKNGVEKLRAGFFSGTYNIWTTHGNPEISCNFSINVGRATENNVVSSSTLSRLNCHIPGEVNVIHISLKVYDISNNLIASSPRRAFWRLGNGNTDFISMGSSDICVQIDLHSAKKIKIEVCAGGETHVLNVPDERLSAMLNVPSLFELYQTSNSYCWTSNTINGAVKAVLIKDSAYKFPDDILHVETKSDDVSSDDSEHDWSWTIQNEKISIINILTGECQDILYKSAAKIEINYLTKNGDYDLKKVLKLNDDNTLDVFVDDECLKIPFLFGSYNPEGSNNLNMSVSYLDDGDSNVKVNAKKIKIEFKPYGDNGTYQEWNLNTKPQQGLYKIRVSVPDNQSLRSAIDTVFYCSGEEPIKRDLGQRRIKISINNVFCENNETHEFDRPVNDYYTDYGYAIELDTIPFVIKTDGVCVLINVYRAYYVNELYREGESSAISTVERPRTPDVSICMRHMYYKRVVDKDGVHYYRNNDLFYFNYTQNPDQLCEFINRDGLNLYVYRGMRRNDDTPRIIIDRNQYNIPTGKISIRVSKRYVEQYVYVQYAYDGSVIPLGRDVRNIEGTNDVWIDFSGIKLVKGVTFQSMKGCTPNRYNRPFYSDTTQRVYTTVRIRENDITQEEQVKAYNLACEHNIYFNILPQFSVLRSNPWKVGEFMDCLLRDKQYVFSADDAKNLARFAVEMSFDWLLMPRAIWIDILKKLKNAQEDLCKCQRSLRLLFEYSPMTMRHKGERNSYLSYTKLIFNQRYFDPRVETSRLFLSVNRRHRDYSRFFMEIIQCENHENWARVASNNYDFYNNPEEILNQLTGTGRPNVFADIFQNYINRNN